MANQHTGKPRSRSTPNHPGHPLCTPSVARGAGSHRWKPLGNLSGPNSARPRRRCCRRRQIGTGLSAAPNGTGLSAARKRNRPVGGAKTEPACRRRQNGTGLSAAPNRNRPVGGAKTEPACRRRQIGTGLSAAPKRNRPVGGAKSEPNRRWGEGGKPSLPVRLYASKARLCMTGQAGAFQAERAPVPQQHWPRTTMVPQNSAGREQPPACALNNKTPATIDPRPQ
jgi:hypothetical protein